MNLITLKNLTILWLILGIPILSFLLLKKTFNLALYGDDWLQLYNLWLSFDVYKTSSFFDIKSYLGAYWPQYFFLGIVRHFFGYQAQAYFAISLILKILATFSLFFLVRELSKSQLAGFLATLIFIFSVAGLQTTDWVFNMNTYAGIFFLNLSIIFYLKMRAIKTLFSFHHLAFIAMFTLALGVVPVRMHGALPFLILTELFLYFFIDKKSILKIDRYLITRISLPILIMFLLVRVGSFGSGGDILPQIQSSLLYLQDMFSKGRYDILFYFFGIIGNLVIPDTLNLGNVFSILVGILLIFFVILVAYHTRAAYRYLAISTILGLLILICFLFLYWIRTPYLIIESTGRYMTMGALGFSILFASVLSIMLKNFISTKNGFILIITIFLLVSWLAVNLKSGQIYLENLEINRNIELSNKTWGTLIKYVPKLDKENPNVFYFTSDNPTSTNMILIFGFGPRAALIYKITGWEKTPVPTENYKELLEMVKSGEPMKKIHGRAEEPIPLSRVYAFDLRGGELVDITGLVRQRLINDLN